MSITLAVMTDGRGHVYETVPSALAHLDGPITRLVMYDDSGDTDNLVRLREAFPNFSVFQHPNGRQGFGGAIRFMWRLLAQGDNPFVFHLEDDFTFRRVVDVNGMTHLLDRHPNLAQVALRRQPWNADERAAGGVVEQHPDDYTEREDGPYRYLLHHRFFTTNPCLYRRQLCLRGWPEDPHSEGTFGARMREDGMAFAFWGSRSDGPWVTHIGRERVGSGY